MHNVQKWSHTLYKSCSEGCKIFKVCLTILARYTQKISIFSFQSFPEPVLKRFPERQPLRNL